MIQLGNRHSSDVDRPSKEYVNIFTQINTFDENCYLFAKKHDGSIVPLEKIPPQNSFGFTSDGEVSSFYTEGRLIYAFANFIDTDEDNYELYQISGGELYAFNAYEEGFNLLVKFTRNNESKIRVNINDLQYVDIHKGIDTEIEAGDIAENMILHLVYTGCEFRVVNCFSSGTGTGAGGGSNNPGNFAFFDVTYGELIDLIHNNELNQGSFYHITDYSYNYYIPYSQVKQENLNKYNNEIHYSEEEGIVVFAIANNKVHSRAFSSKYEYDIIDYDVHYNKNGFEKGLITRRYDTKTNVDLPFDFKNSIVRRWEDSMRVPRYVRPTWEMDFTGFNIHAGILIQDFVFGINDDNEKIPLELEIDTELELINIVNIFNSNTNVNTHFKFHWLDNRLIITMKDSWDWKRFKAHNLTMNLILDNKTNNKKAFQLTPSNREEYVELYSVSDNVHRVKFDSIYTNNYCIWDNPNMTFHNQTENTSIFDIYGGYGNKDISIYSGSNDIKMGNSNRNIRICDGSKNIEIGSNNEFLIFYKGNQYHEVGSNVRDLIMMNYCTNNKVKNHSRFNVFYARSNFNSLGEECNNNTFKENTIGNTIGYKSMNNFYSIEACYNHIGSECDDNLFGKRSHENRLDNGCKSNVFEQDTAKNYMGLSNSLNYIGSASIDNIFGSYCENIKLEQGCSDNKFGNFCKDNLLGANGISNSWGDYCEGNHIAQNYQYNNAEDFFLNNTIQANTSKNLFGYGFKDNIIDGECESNTFGNGNERNKIGLYFEKNRWGDNCSENEIERGFAHNIFEANCIRNTFGVETSHNHFGASCMQNAFFDYCKRNFLGAGTSSNGFASSFTDNRMGRNCVGNLFGEVASHNFIGEGVSFNIFGHSFNNNNIGNEMEHCIIMNDCDHNVFRDQCKFVDMGEGSTGNEIGYRFQGHSISNRTQIGAHCKNNRFGNDIKWLKIPDHYMENVIDIDNLNNVIDMSQLEIEKSRFQDNVIRRKRLNWEYSTFEVDVDLNHVYLNQRMQLDKYKDWAGIFNIVDDGKVEGEPLVIMVSMIELAPKWMIELRPKGDVTLCIVHTEHESKFDNIALKDNVQRLDLNGRRGDWIQFRYDEAEHIWYEYNHGIY